MRLCVISLHFAVVLVNKNKYGFGFPPSQFQEMTAIVWWPQFPNFGQQAILRTQLYNKNITHQQLLPRLI